MQIHPDTFFLLISLAFLLSLIVIITDKRQIAKLKKCVEEEQNKRLTPFLNLAIDRNQLALRLVNEGDALAQHITIEDVSTVIDVGFQKKLLFRFKPIGHIKPGDSALLEIEMFENAQLVPPSVLRQIGGILLSTSFKAYVHCQNIAGIPFCTEIIKEGPVCKMNAVALAE
jgi:hypothetical protein